MKVHYTILTLFTILLFGCNQPTPPPVPNTQHPLAPPSNDNSIVDINEYNTKPKGTMTNEATADMNPEDISTGAKIPPQELLGYIQQAIIPEYKNWVILKNGTYIIFDNIDTIPDVVVSAGQWLSKYKPKTAMDNNWDFSFTDLDQIEGWAVFGNGYGIYTFVHAKELSVNPLPQQIGAYAKAKRALDEKNPQVLFVSSAAGIREIKH